MVLVGLFDCVGHYLYLARAQSHGQGQAITGQRDALELQLQGNNALIPEIPDRIESPGQDSSSDPLSDQTMQPPSIDCGQVT